MTAGPKARQVNLSNKGAIFSAFCPFRKEKLIRIKTESLWREDNFLQPKLSGISALLFYLTTLKIFLFKTRKAVFLKD